MSEDLKRKTRLLVIFSELFMRHRLLNLGEAKLQICSICCPFHITAECKEKKNIIRRNRTQWTEIAIDTWDTKITLKCQALHHFHVG